MTIARKMGFGFGTLLAFTVTLAGVVLCQLASVNRDFSYVIRHDAPVIANARQLAKLVVDMETGQRGFVITGKDEFLDPYVSGREQFAALVATEKRLVDDNPAQVARLEAIERLLQKWEAVAAGPEIAMRRRVSAGQVGAADLQRVLSIGAGKEILDKIRAAQEHIEAAFIRDGNVRAQQLVNSILKNIVDQETGERGFLITGKEVFLEPFRSGQIGLREDTTSLRQLISKAHDRDATSADLAELMRLHLKWVDEAAEPEIAMRRLVDAGEKTQADIEATLRRALGKSMLDQMRRTSERMKNRFEAAENERLAALLLALSKAVVDQETGQRGFLITGQEEFLRPYERGAAAWDQAIADLTLLNKNAYDIATISKDLDEVERLAKEWLKRAANPEIAARRLMNEHPETLADVSAMLEVGTGKRILDSIRASFAEFVEEEERLTAKRFSEASSDSNRTIATTLGVAALAVLIGSILAVKITCGITEPLAQLVALTKRVAAGDLDPAAGDGDLGDLGDLGELRAGFTDMLSSLRDAREQMAERRWFREGHAALNVLIRDSNDNTELANVVLEFLAERTGAHLGVFHLIDDELRLRCAGAFAFEPGERLADGIALGDGPVGQAALTKRRILMSDVPDGYMLIRSGLGALKPANIVFEPIVHADELLGVIELGLVSSVTDRALKFLSQVSESVAIGLSAALARQSLEQGSSAMVDALEREKRSMVELESTADSLRESLADLERFNQLATGRELRMIELKEEINAMCDEMGRPQAYRIDFDEPELIAESVNSAT